MTDAQMREIEASVNAEDRGQRRDQRQRLMDIDAAQGPAR